jgi:serine protease AprX
MKSAYKNLVPYSTSTAATTGVSYNEQADIFTVGAGYLDIPARSTTPIQLLLP